MTSTKRNDGRLLKLSADLRHGFEASEAGNTADALKIYQGVLEKAFDYIRRALATDPLAQPFQNSFDIVVKRIRTALADESRSVDDPSTPRLYDILAGAGEADVLSHVAMARWCVAGGDLQRAAKLTDALVTLYPGEPSAWRCKADVARASGDVGTADECMAEAAVRGGAPEPFAVPGVARG